jgi:hypothetical protein
MKASICCRSQIFFSSTNTNFNGYTNELTSIHTTLNISLKNLYLVNIYTFCGETTKGWLKTKQIGLAYWEGGERKITKIF